jgi:hypothetical protein
MPILVKSTGGRDKMDTSTTAIASKIDPNIFIFISIIVVTGGLGGLVNFFLAQSDRLARASRDDRESNPDQFLPWWQSVIIGIAAASLVPLFLSLISSTLLIEAKNDLVKMFVFAGFCLAAGIASRSFIRGITDRLARQALQIAEEAKENSEKSVQNAKVAQLEAKSATKAAEQATQKADEVRGEASSNLLQAMVTTPLASETAVAVERGVALRGETASRDAKAPQLDQLEAEYVRIRAEMPFGTPRTLAMTRLVRQMSDMLAKVEDFEVLPRLRQTENIGSRLAAFVYLHTNPDFNLLDDLIASAQNAEGFAQYWAILAIGQLLKGKRKAELQSKSYEALQRLLASLKRDSDRHFEMTRILAHLDK